MEKLELFLVGKVPKKSVGRFLGFVLSTSAYFFPAGAEVRFQEVRCRITGFCFFHQCVLFSCRCGDEVSRNPLADSLICFKAQSESPQMNNGVKTFLYQRDPWTIITRPFRRDMYSLVNFCNFIFSKSAKMVALSFTSSQSKPFVQSVQCTCALCKKRTLDRCLSTATRSTQASC